MVVQGIPKLLSAAISIDGLRVCEKISSLIIIVRIGLTMPFIYIKNKILFDKKIGREMQIYTENEGVFCFFKKEQPMEKMNYRLDSSYRNNTYRQSRSNSFGILRLKKWEERLVEYRLHYQRIQVGYN